MDSHPANRHLYGRSVSCVLTCFARLLFSANLLPHPGASQTNGRPAFIPGLGFNAAAVAASSLARLASPPPPRASRSRFLAASFAGSA